MCLEGKTLVLAHHGRAWQVVGTTGPEWMS